MGESLQVIPRGSNALVSSIKQNTKIPVMGHADGICHIYIDEEADLDLACKIVVDAKTDYPAACNAVEKVLVHRKLIGQIYKIQVYRGPPNKRTAPCLAVPDVSVHSISLLDTALCFDVPKAFHCLAAKILEHAPHSCSAWESQALLAWSTTPILKEK